MSLTLESLNIEVKLQTDEIKKGIEAIQSQVQGLEKEFDNLGKSTDKVGQSFQNMLRSTAGTFAAYVGFRALKSAAIDSLSLIREVGNASRELNVDATSLDAWGHAVQRAGGSAEKFQASLSSLATHFGTTNENALRALPRLADSFAKLNPRQAQIYGKSLGLDLSTILLLQQGRREVEAIVAQQQKLGLVTKEQIEVTRKFDNALYDAGRAYQSFYRELAIPILPLISEGIEYLISHKGAVEDSFKAMAAGVGLLSLALIAISGPITKAAAALASLSAAYGLIKEDIEFFKQGKDSAFGNALGFVPGQIKNSDQLGRNIVAQGAGNAFLNIPGQVFGSVKNALGFGGNSESKTEVNIDNVNVNTAATDSDGISNAIKGSLQQQLGQLTSHVDNGVMS